METARYMVIYWVYVIKCQSLVLEINTFHFKGFRPMSRAHERLLQDRLNIDEQLLAVANAFQYKYTASCKK